MENKLTFWLGSGEGWLGTKFNSIAEVIEI